MQLKKSLVRWKSLIMTAENYLIHSGQGYIMYHTQPKILTACWCQKVLLGSARPLYLCTPKISQNTLYTILALLRFFFQVLTGALHTVYHESRALFKKCTRYFFQREASSESNCNRSFRGQPSGWNWWLLQLCKSTRVLPYKSTK